MNVLMTGGGGYIGSHFIKTFSDSNERDKLFLLSSKQIEGYNTINYKNLMFDPKDLSFDSLDVLLLLGAFVSHNKNEKQIVKKHLSSVTSVNYLLDNLPVKPKKIVFCSSIAVYGIDSSLPYVSSGGRLLDENSKVDPVRTYALAKCFNERLVTEYASENNVDLQILRIGSCYNFENNVDSFLGYMIDAYKKKSTFKMLAPPGQVWNFVHVDEVCRWIYNSLFLPSSPGVINLTSSKNYTSTEIVELFKSVNNDFSYEVPNLNCYRGVDKGFDSRKREKYLGEEKCSLETFFKNLK